MAIFMQNANFVIFLFFDSYFNKLRNYFRYQLLRAFSGEILLEEQCRAVQPNCSEGLKF